MKKLSIIAITCFTVLFIVTSVYAGDTDSTDNWRSMCEMVSKLSRVTMTKRQGRVSMQKMMDVTQLDLSEKMTNLWETMVIEAYEEPVYSSKKYQKRAIEDFTNIWHLDCVKKFKNNN